MKAFYRLRLNRRRSWVLYCNLRERAFNHPMAWSEVFSGLVGAGCGVAAALGIEVWRCYVFEPRKKDMEVHAKYEAWLKVLMIDLCAMEEGAAMMETMLRKDAWASIGERFQTQILHEARIGIMMHEKSEKLFARVTSVAIQAAELNVELESRAVKPARQPGIMPHYEAARAHAETDEIRRAIVGSLDLLLANIRSAMREIEFQSQLLIGNSPKLPFAP